MLWYFAVETSHNGLTAEQRNRFRRDGYVVLERVFGADECRKFVRHVDDLSTGRKQLDGFAQQENYGRRTFNQHLYDPLALRFLIDARLHRPLADCFEDEPEAIQTMHFYEGSEHPLHQDQYYLPDCMSAWIAMVDVDEHNGPLVVQPGSHRGRLVTKNDARATSCSRAKPTWTNSTAATSRWCGRCSATTDVTRCRCWCSRAMRCCSTDA